MNIKLYLQRRKSRRLWNTIWKARRKMKLMLYNGTSCTDNELIRLSSLVDKSFEELINLHTAL